MDTPVFQNPPLYSIIAVATVVAVSFGVIFKDMLEYRVALWQANRTTQDRIEYARPALIFSYLMTSLALLVFVIAGLVVFGFPISWAEITGSVLVIGTAVFIWIQLGSLLKMLAQGGSAAIDIEGEYPLNPEPATPAEAESPSQS
jgi:hypothetical protein